MQTLFEKTPLPGIPDINFYVLYRIFQKIDKRPCKKYVTRLEGGGMNKKTTKCDIGEEV